MFPKSKTRMCVVIVSYVHKCAALFREGVGVLAGLSCVGELGVQLHRRPIVFQYGRQKTGTISITGFDVLDRAVHKTFAWMHELGCELGVEDKHKLWIALRASLHALRDRLPHAEVAQLPLIVRGLFYDGWESARTPMKRCHRDAFFKLVAKEFPPGFDLEPEAAFRATMKVLRQHVSSGEIEGVLQSLLKDIRETVAA